MNVRKIYFYFIGLATLFTLLGSFFWVSSLEEPKDSWVILVSIGLDQQVLTTEVSSYEILRANEHFSDIVLGWTVEPSFANELRVSLGESVSFTGQRQEKQNLIFTIEGQSSPDAANALINLISSRLTEYNEITHSAYKVALAKVSFIEAQDRSDLRLILGATLLGFLLYSAGIIFWEYATRR